MVSLQRGNNFYEEMQDKTESSMEFIQFSMGRFKTVDTNAVTQVKSQIHDKAAIQLPLVFLEESHKKGTFECLALFKI